MVGSEIGFLTNLPIHLEITDRIEAFQHGLILRGAACKQLS